MFRGSLDYSDTAFRQITLIYEEVTDMFKIIYSKIASMISIRAEFKTLLQRIRETEHVAAIVLTYELR